MKKLIISSAALLGASVMTSSAYAAMHAAGYVENSPQKASITITLSGACSANITLPVMSVEYGTYYFDNDVPGTVDKDSSSAYLHFFTADSDISVIAHSETESRGEKISERVKNDKRAIAFNIVGSDNEHANFSSLANGDYDSQIKCKDGLSLQSQIPGWDAWYDGRGEKVSGSLSHTNSVSEPSVGTYKAKFSSSGTLEIPGQCVLKGVLGSADYSVVCAPSKSIKIKLTASASGTSST